MKLVPLGDRIIAKQLEAREKTKSGIILTGQAKEKPLEGIVAAVGSGIIGGNERVPMLLHEGDHILISPYGFMEVKFEEETYLIMRQSDVLGIVVEADEE